MKQILWVGIGGCIGAVVRFKIGAIILHTASDWKFPISTFAVNVSGCFIAGILAGLAEKHDLFGADLRLFLFTGLLGGYTTFSAFGIETVYLLQRNEMIFAVANAILSVLFCIVALWLGIKIIP